MKEIKLTGKGRQWSEKMLPLEERKDLKTMKATKIGDNIYVPLSQYLKAVEALECEENSVESLETMLDRKIPVTPKTVITPGLYTLFWLNREEEGLPIPKHLKALYADLRVEYNLPLLVQSCLVFPVR